MESVKGYSSVLDELIYAGIDADARSAINDFLTNLRNRPLNPETVESDFAELCPAELAPWLVSSIVERVNATKEQIRLDHERKLKDMPDTVINVISANDKTKAAIRRNNPKNWDMEKGTGKVPHALLTGWTAAVSIAIEGLMEVRPNTGSIKWRTGWIYQLPEMTWESDSQRPRPTEAAHRKKGAVHELMLNPVDEDGKITYSITKDEDIWKLLVFAVHEVTHIAVEYHNEDFATLRDDIMTKLNPVDAIKRVKKTMAATAKLYGNKNLKIQALDSESGPRPADQLLRWSNGNKDAPTNDLESEYRYG